MLKYYAAQDVAAKTAATDSEKFVQKLLRDIQQAHPELRNNLKGPPELRKDLVATLRHKEDLRASVTGDKAAKLDEETATLKAFLNSRQLASLDEKTAAPLTTLVRAADQKYGNWQRLETTANALEAAAAKALKEAAKETSTTTTEEELAQAKDKQEKREALLTPKVSQANTDAVQAKWALDKADKAIMDKIEVLLGRHQEMSKMLPRKEGDSNIGRLDPDGDAIDDDDDHEIEKENFNLSSAPIQEMRELHQKENDDH